MKECGKATCKFVKKYNTYHMTITCEDEYTEGSGQTRLEAFINALRHADHYNVCYSASTFAKVFNAMVIKEQKSMTITEEWPENEIDPDGDDFDEPKEVSWQE